MSRPPYSRRRAGLRARVLAVGALLSLAACGTLRSPDGGTPDAGAADAGPGQEPWLGDGGPFTFRAIPVPAGAPTVLKVAGDAQGSVYALLQQPTSTRLLTQLDAGLLVPVRRSSELNLLVTPTGTLYMVDLYAVMGCAQDCATAAWGTLTTAQGTDYFTAACLDGERPYLVALTDTSSLVVYEPSATAPFTFTRRFVAYLSGPTVGNCAVQNGTVWVALESGLGFFGAGDAGTLVPAGSNTSSVYDAVRVVGGRGVLVGACGEAAERQDDGSWLAVRPTACGAPGAGSGFLVAAGHHPAEVFAFGFGPSNAMVSHAPGDWATAAALPGLRVFDAFMPNDNLVYLAGSAVDAAGHADGGALWVGTR